MWSGGWSSRFHARSASRTPLLPQGSVSTATTLDPTPEQDDDGEQPCDVPGTSQRPKAIKNRVVMSVAPGTAGSVRKVTPPPVPIALETPPSRDVESNDSSRMRSIKTFFMEEIDTAQASAPLTVYCFMTGFIDAVSFSAMYVWCAFQTGNSVQLSIALTRLFNGTHDQSFHIADQQALCSLIAFIVGALIGRIGDKIGCKTRLWMTLGTFIQTLFTMIAAIIIWKSGSGSVATVRGIPAWSDTLSFVALGFISASMGLQGIMGKRLNTQFTTTVVLTTTWCELMTEPTLFNVRRLVASRDHKAMAILVLFLGGFTGSALLNKVGDPITLAIATAIRFVLTLGWLFVPAKQVKS